MTKLRVNGDDVLATAAGHEASAIELTGGRPGLAGPSCQASAAAVQAVRAGAARVKAMAAARTAATGGDISAANASYTESEVESATRLRTVGSEVV